MKTNGSQNIRYQMLPAKFNELRKVLTNTNVHMHTRRKILEVCVRSRLTYGTQAALPNEQQMKMLEACWYGLLRNMIKGGWACGDSEETEEENISYLDTNIEVEEVIRTMSPRNFIYTQYLEYVADV